LVAGLLGYVVLTWRRGRKVLRERLYSDVPKLRTYLETKDPTLLRVGGTAVFMTGNPVFVPKAMLHNIRHNKVLHERVVLMTVRVEDVPYVPDEERVEVERLGKGFFRVTAHYGFVEEPDVPRALELCRSHALPIDPALTSYFLSAETMIPSERPDLNTVEERLFMLLSASGQSATAYFRIPPDQVVELGIQLEI
jgi:KUP system potassium uptake protein